MYPYRNRFRWLLFGRYSHLVKAVNERRRVLQDSTLEHRVNSLQAWNTLRFGVSVLLSLGVAATVASAVANLFPDAAGFVRPLVAISSTTTGALTVVYLFLTRLLGQLEIDILAILTLDHSK